MSLFAAATAVRAASPENPSTTLGNPARWLVDLFGGTSDAGVSVNEATSLKYSAVWNATTIISSDIATLPIDIFEKDKSGDKKEIPDHDLSRLLNHSPNEQMSAPAFRQAGMVHNLLWGNMYAGIVRNGSGKPASLLLLHPAHTYPEVSQGRLRYISRMLLNGDNISLEIKPSDMIHVPGLTTDGITGLSVIGHARNAIGLGLAMEKFGSKFFSNGANLSGVIEHPGTFKDAESKKNFAKSWHDVYSGTDNALKTAVLEMGMTYKNIGIPPNDAQFLDSRKFGINEIARWFNIPEYKLGSLDRATFNNIEHMAIDYVVRTIVPRLKFIKSEFERKLFTEREKIAGRYSIEFNINALLEGSIETKGRFIDLMIKNGVYNINDGRGFLNMNKVPGGDRHFIQRDKMPLDRYDDFVDRTVFPTNV